MHSRPSVKHVLEVLEWFYKLTEKILFQKRGLVFYYPRRTPPPWFGKRPYFCCIFFLHPSLTPLVPPIIQPIYAVFRYTIFLFHIFVSKYFKIAFVQEGGNYVTTVVGLAALKKPLQLAKPLNAAPSSTTTTTYSYSSSIKTPGYNCHKDSVKDISYLQIHHNQICAI